MLLRGEAKTSWATSMGQITRSVLPAAVLRPESPQSKPNPFPDGRPVVQAPGCFLSTKSLHLLESPGKKKSSGEHVPLKPTGENRKNN